ncbi:MAG: glycosyltransferase family 39 protein [Candidatus Bathyarchaeota archaeon]|nr:glycosyltransferase family 39 protein [Candidatus Bathyarchaeota archaeon]
MVSFPAVKQREVIGLAVLLALAALVRVLLYPQQGYPIDTNCFTSWFNTAATSGIHSFYQVTWSDYPPFNVYIFWFFGSIANAASNAGINAVNIVKLVPTLFDLATAILIYVFMRKQLGAKQTLIATALYAFNPAIIFNVAWWGQFDAIYTFFMLLSLMLALKKKPELAAVIFAVALLTKPQGIALLPLVALVIFLKDGAKRLLTSIGAFAAALFLLILPFDWAGNPVTFLSNIYFGAYSGYQFTSINAFNIWGMFGMWVPDGNLFIVGWVLFGLFAAFFLYVAYKRFKVDGDSIILFSAAMMFFAFFMLPTRIHERYLFPVLSVLVLLFMLYKKTRPLYIGLTATLLVNEAYILYWLNVSYPNASPSLSGDPVVVAVSIINLALFFYGTLLMWNELKGRSWLSPSKPESDSPSQNQPRGDPPK